MGAPPAATEVGKTNGAPSKTANVIMSSTQPPQPASFGRGTFQKLFSRARKSGGGSSVVTAPEETSSAVPNNNTSVLKSPSAAQQQRDERAPAKKGVKRWNRISGGSVHSSPISEERNNNDDCTDTIQQIVVREDVPPRSRSLPQIIRPQGMASSSSEQPQPITTQQESESENPVVDPEAEEARRTLVMQKKLIKERDGFCRRVDYYDGHVITVDGRPCYELGSYLGGGVAGVVYEGHRLRPAEEYPVRLGKGDNSTNEISNTVKRENSKPPGIISVWGCVPSSAEHAVQDETKDDTGVLNWHTRSQLTTGTEGTIKRRNRTFKEDLALEMTLDNKKLVMIEPTDAPSRSGHYAKALSMNSEHHKDDEDQSISYAFMEETVAIKVLNPVSFRTLEPAIIRDAVVARKGARMEADVVSGQQPMEERHVWWLINPNSRNLRTLQRYSVPFDPNAPRRVEVDRGSAERGLRISLVAAYRDELGQLKELPLTRCIEVWGHVPFGATDAEFRCLLKAIDSINAGLPPPAVPAFFRNGTGITGRVETDKTGSNTSNATTAEESSSLESHRPKPMQSKRTGIYRAATTTRTTVYCDELKAYIALPAVPSKYIKWLRQRRAATKEIRNMMLIGRHRNVVHLFEVLELIQEKKSTMFLILELVRGGELFDLISSNAAKLTKGDIVPPGFTEAETVMRRFFQELACGIRYCHHNGIAHRDLKPENLLVHNTTDGRRTLKIADFGLSAVFNVVNGEAVAADDATNTDASYISSYMSSPPPPDEDILPGVVGSIEDSEQSAIKSHVTRILSVGGSALSFFTCGAVDDSMLTTCAPSPKNDEGKEASPLKRMTSVVGSPHYVAPEIISQTEKRHGRFVGYDGAKADVWSAGVILYAMLFRSLPFGEDLLRCPRFQSFRKWYEEVKHIGRRASPLASLDPVITEQDERELLGPQWFFPSKTSPQSRDLIVAMLNPDPDFRPSINHVLRHPWLLRNPESLK